MYTEKYANPKYMWEISQNQHICVATYSYREPVPALQKPPFSSPLIAMIIPMQPLSWLVSPQISFACFRTLCKPTVQCVLFYIWLHSLNAMFLRSIHTVACGMFLFSWLVSILLRYCTINNCIIYSFYFVMDFGLLLVWFYYEQFCSEPFCMYFLMHKDMHFYF